MYDKENVLSELRNLLSEKRFAHTLGVATMAGRLAERYGENPERAELAGLLHDSAKELSLEEMKVWLFKAGYEVDTEVSQSRALLHGPAGAAFAKMYFGVRDKGILSAIYHHTFGKSAMSLLEEIVFLADYIEPNRHFEGVDRIRELAWVDLDRAALAGFDSTIGHLLAIQAEIYAPTVVARNYLIKKIRGLNEKTKETNEKN